MQKKPFETLIQDLKNHFKTLGVVRNLAQNHSEKLLTYLLKESPPQRRI